MKKNLLFAFALLASATVSAQTIVWPSTVNRETKEANVKATVTGSETITAADITPGADIAIGQKDDANAVTAVKDATGANIQFPSETEGMISWRPTAGNVEGSQATADLAEGTGAYLDFKIEESDINKDLTGLTSIEFDVTKVGTDAIRINAKLIGEGDSNVDTGWLIDEATAKSFGDEYTDEVVGEDNLAKYGIWDADANAYNPSRNDGSKGAAAGANANGISHVKLAIPAELIASNPYALTLRIAIVKCANNKDLALNNVTFNFGSEEPAPVEKHTYSVIGTIQGNWDVDTDMELASEGGYTVLFENVAAGSYEFKIRQDHDWTVNWGSDYKQDGPNYLLDVTTDGSNIVISFDPTTGQAIAVVFEGEEPAPAGNEILLWEGEAISTGWANQPGLLSDGGAELTEAGAAVGDIIRFYCTAPDDNWQCELTEGHWGGIIYRYAAKDLGPNEDGSAREYEIVDLSKGYIDLVITEDILTKATTQQWWGNVFLLNGDGGLTVTKLTLIKADETAINAAKVAKAAKVDGDIYNLAGQKVSASYKGLVIKDGKKYIQK